MKGDGEYYLRKTKDMETELKKLERAKHKYTNILCDIDREINEKREEIKRSIHCYSTCTADSENSLITD
jgi:hypothetical protein